MKPILDPDDVPRSDAKTRSAESTRARSLHQADTKDWARLAAAAGVDPAALETRADRDFAAAKLEAEAWFARVQKQRSATHGALAPLRERLQAGYARTSGGT